MGDRYPGSTSAGTCCLLVTATLLQHRLAALSRSSTIQQPGCSVTLNCTSQRQIILVPTPAMESPMGAWGPTFARRMAVVWNPLLMSR